MNPENINSIVNDYLKKSQTQYALLINGSWGSGKTFFWKNKLINEVIALNLKTMYVSLNGVNSIDKLEQLIFLQLIPKLGESQSEIVKNLTTVSKNIANAASKFFFKSDVTDLVKGTSVKAFGFKDYCICFDDLERCKVPIDELFGYLADFVEHKYLKCVFLADEQKIKDQEKNQNLVNGYEVIKEKIIGRVLNYDPNLKEVIPLLIDSYKNNKELHSFLVKYSNFLIKTFSDQKIKNLRIVKFYLENIETVFKPLKSADENYIVECLFLLAIFSIEFKEGRLESKDVANFDDYKAIDANWYSHLMSNFLSKSKEDKVRVKSRAELFYEKYLLSDIDKYYFYPSLYNYILSGHFSKDVFKAELKLRKPEEISDEKKVFRKLLNYKFRELDDDEFQRLFTKVFDYAKSGRYWFYDYKQIANFFFYFLEKNLVEIDNKTIDIELVKGVKIAAKRKEIHDYTYENLMHFDNNNPKTQKVLDTISKCHNEIKAEQNQSISSKVINCIAGGDKVALATLFKDHKYNKELLQYLDVNGLLNHLENISNDMIFVLAELLKDRYNYSNPQDILSLDLLFLEKFLEGVKNYTSTIDKPLRSHNLDELLDTLEKSIEKLKK